MLQEKEEVWKVIPGYPDYAASSLGRIRRETPGQGARAGYVLRPYNNHTGTWCVVIRKDGERKTHIVGRLVLMAHVGSPPAGTECCHGPRGRDCHELSNLSWGTKSKNYGEDKLRDGTDNRGAKNPRAKLSQAEVELIYKLAHDAVLRQKQIAECFFIDQNTVSDIKNGKTWSHVTGHHQK